MTRQQHFPLGRAQGRSDRRRPRHRVRHRRGGGHRGRDPWRSSTSNRKPLEHAAAQLRRHTGGAEIVVQVCDVSSYESVCSARQALEGGWGRADVLVNNAGIFSNAPAHEIAVEEWDRVLQVNLSGAFYCSQVFGASMIEARSGNIVCIASMSGLIVNRPQPQVGYNVSKAASSCSQSHWRPNGPLGIRVNAVAPGYIGQPRGGRQRRRVPGVGRRQLRDRRNGGR